MWGVEGVRKRGKKGRGREKEKEGRAVTLERALSISRYPLSPLSRKSRIRKREDKLHVLSIRTLSLASSASARAAAASSCCSVAAFDGADADADTASSTAAWRSAILLSRALSFFRDCVILRGSVLSHIHEIEKERGRKRRGPNKRNN